MALMLQQKGVLDARPLIGGFNALVAVGYPMELKEPVLQPKKKITLGAGPAPS